MIFLLWFLWNYKCHDWSLKHIHDNYMGVLFCMTSINLQNIFQWKLWAIIKLLETAQTSTLPKILLALWSWSYMMLLTILEGGSKRFFLSRPRNSHKIQRRYDTVTWQSKRLWISLPSSEICMGNRWEIYFVPYLWKKGLEISQVRLVDSKVYTDVKYLFNHFQPLLRY